MNWTKADWRKADESTFYLLKQKNQYKIWRLEKEKHILERLQQTNTGDDGKMGIWSGISGFRTTNAKVHMRNMNGQLYCDVLETELKRSMAKFQKIVKWFTKKISPTITYIEHIQK